MRWLINSFEPCTPLCWVVADTEEDAIVKAIDYYREHWDLEFDKLDLVAKPLESVT